jgi:peptidoglycan/LPS O-acetylase OafA/YrhL
MKLDSIQKIHASFFLFFYNYARFFTAGSIPSSLNVFWSLCFEEQFYVSLFLISIIQPKRINLLLGTGIAFSLLLRFYFFITHYQINPYQMQMWTHFRLDAILLGCFIYYYWERLKKYFRFFYLNLFLFFIVSFLHSKLDLAFQGILYTFITLIFTALVFNSLKSTSNKISALIRHPFLTNIGLISFEIYLVHEIVIGFVTRLDLEKSPLLFIILSMTITFIAAFFLNRTFSNPVNVFLRKKYILN